MKSFNYYFFLCNIASHPPQNSTPPHRRQPVVYLQSPLCFRRVALRIISRSAAHLPIEDNALSGYQSPLCFRWVALRIIPRRAADLAAENNALSDLQGSLYSWCSDYDGATGEESNEAQREAFELHGGYS